MGSDLPAASTAARDVFAQVDRALGGPDWDAAASRRSLSQLCFESTPDELARTEIQQPAILATSLALLAALEERAGIPLRPAYVAGHSLGEYTALVASGSLGIEDAVRLVHARGRCMQEAVPIGEGAMAAVLGAPREVIERVCREAGEETAEVVTPANYNEPRQTVIAGTVGAVARAGEKARQSGARRVVPLRVSAPFHCELMQPAAEKLRAELDATRFDDPRAPVVTNVTARPNARGERVADLLHQQMTAPVRFVEMIEHLVERGVRRVLEVGPGRVLGGLVARIAPGLERFSLTDADGLDDAARFVAEPAVSGSREGES